MHELRTGDSTPPPPPPKNDQKTQEDQRRKDYEIACYADDPREPDLIGDVEVDLTEVLTKGETDGKAINIALTLLSDPPSEWFTLTNKDKFAGKVYLGTNILVQRSYCLGTCLHLLTNTFTQEPPRKRRLHQNLQRVTSITGGPAHLYLQVKCLQVLELRLRTRRTMAILTRAWMFCLRR